MGKKVNFMQSENNIVQKTNRNVGLDILRIFSMLGIVTLHILGHGGVLDFSSIAGGVNYYALSFLKAISYFSVNVFVLISGYFLCQKKFRLEKLIALIFEIVFWGTICYLASIFLGNNSFSVFDFVKSLFAWLVGVYWFPTVYLALYILSPFINILVRNINKETHGMLLIAVLFVAVMPFF